MAARGLSLRQRAVRGAIALSGANVLAYGLAFVSTLVLAHLLAPRQFGEVALAIAIVELLFIATAGSLSMAVIRESAERAEAAFDVAFVLTWIIGTVTFVVSAAIAAAIWLLSSHTLALMIIAIAGGRVALLVGYTYNAELERRLAYGRVSVNQFVATVVASLVALGLGYSGAQGWSLVARDVIVSVLSLVLAYASSAFRFRRTFDRTLAKNQIIFGVQMIGSRIGDLLFHRYDNLVVGLVAGTRQLGLYNQGYILTEVGSRILGPVLQQVPFAAYAQLQGDRRRTSATFQIVTFFLLRATVPMAVLFIVLPSPLLGALFGAPWRGAAPMLRLLAVYALLQPLFDHMRVVLVANGEVKRVLVARAIQLVFFVPAVVVGALVAGGVGASLTVALGTALGTGTLLYSTRRVVDYRLSDSVAPLVAGAAATAVAAAVASRLHGDWLILGGAGTALAFTYLVVLGALDWRRLRENIRILRMSSPIPEALS